MQQTPGGIDCRKLFVVIVVGKQVPLGIKAQAAAVSQSAGVAFEFRTVGIDAHCRADAVVLLLFFIGAIDEGPMSPVIGAREVTVVPRRIAEREE